MSVKFLNDSEIEFEHAKVQAIKVVDIGDKILPYNELSPDGFEHLLYAIYKKLPNCFHDRTTLMVTGADKGRDVWLTKNEKPVGLIQCKRERQGFDVIKALKEIIKFLLFAHLEPKLLTDPKQFKYTLALSSDPASTTVDFFTTPADWLQSNSDRIEPCIEKVINAYVSFSGIKLSDVSDKIKRYLADLQYELIRPVDLNELLNELPTVSNRFFHSSRNVDAEAVSRVLIQQLSAQFLPALQSTKSDIAIARTSALSSIENVPLPKALASRKRLVDSIVDSLKCEGIAWVYGVAGVGKTVAAKMAAKELNGNWFALNLRGLNPEETCNLLSSALVSLAQYNPTGLLVDDLTTDFEPIVFDTLVNLHSTCVNSNTCLIFTSSKRVDSDFLLYADLPSAVETKVEDFSEDDLSEILTAYGVDEAYWTKYIYLISGGGHPQLVTATIQSMCTNNWDLEEFRTLRSLLEGNEAIENVRKKTRARLLKDLPYTVRKLIERLSVFSGRFKHQLVLDLAKLPPEIEDGGLLFEQIVGSWIDQHDVDYFSLSPLLTNYAKATLTEQEQKDVHYQIASSLIDGKKSLDPIDINSAFMSALVSSNEHVLLTISIAIISTDGLERVAPYLSALSFMRPEVPLYKDNLYINQMLRAAQVLVLGSQDKKAKEFQEAFTQFKKECDDLQEESGTSSLLKIAVYSKLLLAPNNFGYLSNSSYILKEIDYLYHNKEELLPKEVNPSEVSLDFDGVPAIGFMVINQAINIKSIDDLLPFFELVDSLSEAFRDSLFVALEQKDFGADMLLSSAWLSEEDAGTIDCEKHTQVFEKLERICNKWGSQDLAVCCRKLAIIIWDETGGKSDLALELISDGFEIYGIANPVLIRAKAKIFYRAKNYSESLELSKQLLDADVKLTVIEKANLCRDTAISAEEECQFDLAKKYFLLGSQSASECPLEDMNVMRVGLLADASLSAWRAGDKEQCLKCLSKALQELEAIDPKESLNASHCHATARHILLWIQQEATGKIQCTADGGEVKVYPGIVSNPSPSKEIANHKLAPLNMAWYSLASLENYLLLDIGIASRLNSVLRNGVIAEGEFILASSKIEKAICQSDACSFTSAFEQLCKALSFVQLKETAYEAINEFSYIDDFDTVSVDFNNYVQLAERFILEFSAVCALRNKLSVLDELLERIKVESKISIRGSFHKLLTGGNAEVTDLMLYFAQYIGSQRYESITLFPISPQEVFQKAFMSMWIFGECSNSHSQPRVVFEWLRIRWMTVWERQRALLRNPNNYFSYINKALTPRDNSWAKSTLNLLTVILPTLGVSDEVDVKRKLDEMHSKVS
ncbi:hypothetical protein AB6E16_06795 [Vibrio atlanticus]|uniref:hypothetical protein n=1 Tax=Vibrio atlanticus TaxID=693153 RepID=UPI003553637A